MTFVTLLENVIQDVITPGEMLLLLRKLALIPITTVLILIMTGKKCGDHSAKKTDSMKPLRNFLSCKARREITSVSRTVIH
jgi:hypothetical protein